MGRISALLLLAALASVVLATDGCSALIPVGLDSVTLRVPSSIRVGQEVTITVEMCWMDALIPWECECSRIGAPVTFEIDDPSVAGPASQTVPLARCPEERGRSCLLCAEVTIRGIAPGHTSITVTADGQRSPPEPVIVVAAE
jgi:hypothetical protein